MSTNKVQSAIREVRDQLFLDTADGVRLTAVSGNLGLTRPKIGATDDIWRAVVKKIAFKRKNVRPIFDRILEVLFGPQFARIGTLAADAALGATSIVLNDSSALIQRGTITLDPGLATEEVVAFCYRDLVTHEVFLESPLTFAHTAKYEDITNFVSADIAATATSIPVFDSSQFPVVGFPYPVLLGRGTEQEEVVLVSANAANVLTTSATVNDHAGPTSRFIRKTLLDAAPTGQTFLQLDLGDTRDLPASGFLVLARNTAAEEYIQYRANDVATNSLLLKTPITSATGQAAGVSIELLNEGVPVDLLDVWQKGAYWDIFTTTPRCIQIYIPQATEGLRSIDGSWLHGPADQTPAATTLAVAASAGDTVIALASAAGFPGAETLLLSGTETVFGVLDADAVPNPTMTLSAPLVGPHLLGASVAVVEYNYAGTDLKEGNIRDAIGAVIDGRFPGPYLYDQAQNAPSITSTTLVTKIPESTHVAVDQVIARSCLEVLDVSDFGATPFDVRVAKDTGAQEDLTVVDVTAAAGLSTTVATANIGTSFIDAAASAGFPESSDGVTVAGYQVVIDQGGGNEEVVTISQNGTTLANRFLLTDPLTATHVPGETIKLLNDVLTVDPTTRAHTGRDLSSSEVGDTIDPLLDEIELTSGSGFPTTGGSFWINFGKARVNARATLSSIVGPTVYALSSTDDFPTTDYPYRAVVGEGTANEEIASVTGNDTALDRLTFASAPANAHADGVNIRYLSGDPETLTYVDRDLNTLVFGGPTLFSSKHTIGESVTYSPGVSIPPTDGSGYPLLMPPDFYAFVKLLLDLVRAAGVKVQFITNR